jgi:type I restriction enzyme M protein
MPKLAQITLSNAEITEKVEWGRSGKTIRDYISGVLLRATPEEVDAVQVFSRRLVEDYGYAKNQIQTRPQYRVRSRPSGGDNPYPVDIAVFRDGNKSEEGLYLVVECKNKNRKDGIAQLKLYLDMSSAELGAWFNGDDHLYLRKLIHKDGRRTYQEMPNLPRNSQRIEDVGLFYRRDLRKPSNLKALFRDIRNHLAGNTTGITRDEALAQEIINLLFCKIYDEINTGKSDIVTFRMGVGESPSEVRKRILSLFEQVKVEYGDVFLKRDAISLDAASIGYVVGELQPYSITESDRDAIGEAFEVFIGPALRGAEGQFFTPRNVVRMMIDLLAPKPGETILDPACGSGGFLITALEHVWLQVEAEGIQKGWTDRQTDRRKRDIATRCFRGIDKDSFLAKVTKAYMAIIGDGRGGVFCENSLYPQADWNDQKAVEAIPLGQFDVVMTNPPFGSKIRVKGSTILSQYDLARKWKRDKKTGAYEPTAERNSELPPQILFLERCIQFLKPGGRLGIVLPESILGNPSYEFLLAFIRSRMVIRTVITLPEALFKTSGKGGTHTKVCVLILENTKPSQDIENDIFMSSVEWCGHDSRGNPTLRRNANGEEILLDEVPSVAEKCRQYKRGKLGTGSRLGFSLPVSEIRNNILVPEYYDPEIAITLEILAKSHDIISLRTLVNNGIVHLTTGVEIGKMAYGTGTIPFIRTSDLSNWEIKADFKHGVSQDIYDEYKDKVDVQALDILMVRDGTYLIGTTAMVTDSDLPMLFQSHIYRIRVNQPDKLSPWLLFIALNAPVVKKQIRAKQFTQDIIDTIGQRVLELQLPIPRDRAMRDKLAERARCVIETRALLRNDGALLPVLLQGGEDAQDAIIALRRLAEIKRDPSIVIGGAELEKVLSQLERE